MNKIKTVVMPVLAIGIFVVSMLLLASATSAPCSTDVPFFLTGTVHECAQ
jgi:hypothetical protein